MKKYSFKFAIATILMVGLCSCSKSNNLGYADPDIIDVSTVNRIDLVASHTMLVADGKAVIDLTPMAYTKDNDKIYGPRVKDEWFDFTSDQPNVKVGHYFSTSDKSLIGKTIKVKINLKDRKSIVSNEVSFTVVAPLEVKKTYTIPVIFHIVQTKEDIESYGGPFDRVRINQLINRLNTTFAGSESTSPTGIDTKILFKPALYDPSGTKLAEPGINRLIVNEIVYDNNTTKVGLNNLLTTNKLIWPAKNYMNIWIISSRTGSATFGWTYGYASAPKFRNPSSTNIPEGLTLTDVYTEKDLSMPNASGVMYKLQSLNTINNVIGSAGSPGENDLIHYVGSYFGLLRSAWFVDAIDYCNDTQKYIYKNGENTQLYKTIPNGYFMSENIMDDPTGIHRSITQQQYLRIQWILENSPERIAWKSNFAFIGK